MEGPFSKVFLWRKMYSVFTQGRIRCSVFLTVNLEGLLVAPTCIGGLTHEGFKTWVMGISSNSR